uniref:ribosomal protein S11 n=1 Tax=Geranium koreanum TaxID=345232 RepID=UPI00202896A2|nr:ribosomal protein S11 [Geranium koreanum]UED15775.1 ribosomal protein S11 [Geranium koreanum]
MAKPVQRYSSFSLRRNRRTRLRLGIRKGIIHVQASFSNTIVTITDRRGRVVVWASASSGASNGEFTGRPGVDDLGSEKGLRDFRKRGVGDRNR